MSTKLNLHRTGLDRFQCLLNFSNRLLRFLADKLQRDMHRLWLHPARIRSETMHAFHVARNACADRIVYIKSDEDAHER